MIITYFALRYTADSLYEIVLHGFIKHDAVV